MIATHFRQMPTKKYRLGLNLVTTCRAELKALCSRLTLVVMLTVCGISQSFSLTTSWSDNDAQNGPITIAVASNFRFPLERVIASSEYWSQQNIRLVTGSTGVLYAQIVQGAPFDVFLSADHQRPIKLAEQGLANEPALYASGKLALWPMTERTMSALNNNSRTYVNTEFVKGILREQQGKFAIAHPELAPFGFAAKAYLDDIGTGLKARLVLGNNVTQAFQFIDSGNASMGFVAESLLIQASLQFKKAKYHQYVLPDAADYPPILQYLVVLTRTQHTAKAQAFADFLQQEDVQKQLQALGYAELAYELGAQASAQTSATSTQAKQNND